MSLSDFNGKCYECNKMSHRAKKCPEASTDKGIYGKGMQFSGNCNDCGKEGHKDTKCWQKEGYGEKVQRIIKQV